MAFDLDGYVPATGVGAEFPNSVRDAPFDPIVPALMEDTSDLVQEYLDFNKATSLEAIEYATGVMDALAEWEFPDELPDPPAAPSIITSFNAELGIGFTAPPNLGDITADPIQAFTVDDVTIPDIESELPAYVSLGLVLNLPDSPTLNLPSEPTEPGIDYDIDLPTAPEKDYGGSPDLDEITLPAYDAPVLPVFADTAPEFDTLPPSPFIVWTEPVYSSDIKNAVEAVLETMLAGGTGIPADVENAIWERAADRDDVAGNVRAAAAISLWAARGFPSNAGQINAQTLAIGDSSESKKNELSRERAIAQADLEQKNRQFAVTNALSYEQIFVGVFLAITDRNFQIAKFGVETQIQIFNMQVTAFNVEQSVFAQKIALYRSQLEAALFYLKAYEAQIELEKAKAQVNEAKVRAFEAKVKAYGEQVNAYGQLVKAATVRADLQRSKVDIYKAQIEGMVGKINGERAKFEAYDARIRGEVSKVALEEANVRAFAAQVQAWSQRSETEMNRARLTLEGNKQTLDWNIANMQRITAATGQQLQRIQANLSAFQANVAQAVARYEADKSGKATELQAQVSLSGVAIAKYQAMLEQWKVRALTVTQFADMNLGALKAVGQMASTWVSGSLAGTHVSAGLSASSSASQTSGRSTADNTQQSKTITENSQYTVSHNYQHRV